MVLRLDKFSTKWTKVMTSIENSRSSLDTQSIGEYKSTLNLKPRVAQNRPELSDLDSEDEDKPKKKTQTQSQALAEFLQTTPPWMPPPSAAPAPNERETPRRKSLGRRFMLGISGRNHSENSDDSGHISRDNAPSVKSSKSVNSLRLSPALEKSHPPLPTTYYPGMDQQRDNISTNTLTRQLSNRSNEQPIPRRSSLKNNANVGATTESPSSESTEELIATTGRSSPITRNHSSTSLSQRRLMTKSAVADGASTRDLASFLRGTGPQEASTPKPQPKKMAESTNKLKKSRSKSLLGDFVSPLKVSIPRRENSNSQSTSAAGKSDTRRAPSPSDQGYMTAKPSPGWKPQEACLPPLPQHTVTSAPSSSPARDEKAPVLPPISSAPLDMSSSSENSTTLRKSTSVRRKPAPTPEPSDVASEEISRMNRIFVSHSTVALLLGGEHADVLRAAGAKIQMSPNESVLSLGRELAISHALKMNETGTYGSVTAGPIDIAAANQALPVEDVPLTASTFSCDASDPNISYIDLLSTTLPIQEASVDPRAGSATPGGTRTSITSKNTIPARRSSTDLRGNLAGLDPAPMPAHINEPTSDDEEITAHSPVLIVRKSSMSTNDSRGTLYPELGRHPSVIRSDQAVKSVVGVIGDDDDDDHELDKKENNQLNPSLNPRRAEIISMAPSGVDQFFDTYSTVGSRHSGSGTASAASYPPDSAYTPRPILEDLKALEHHLFSASHIISRLVRDLESKEQPNTATTTTGGTFLRSENTIQIPADSPSNRLASRMGIGAISAPNLRALAGGYSAVGPVPSPRSAHNARSTSPTQSISESVVTDEPNFVIETERSWNQQSVKFPSPPTFEGVVEKAQFRKSRIIDMDVLNYEESVVQSQPNLSPRESLESLFAEIKDDQRRDSEVTLAQGVEQRDRRQEVVSLQVKEEPTKADD